MMECFDPEKYRVPGILGNGISVGIKKNGGKDLALIYSERPAVADGVFTTNVFKAAPVLLDIERIKKGQAQAILINSGNANAATGDEGYASARAMSKFAAEQMGINDDLVMVSSTGVIGEPLPLGKIRDGMERLVQGLHPRGLVQVQEAIMTTDRFPKMVLQKTHIGEKEITICGLAKGAGMIEPNMATMLSYILTDVAIDQGLLKRIFRQGVEKTYNAISVDGCMSTNDTVLIMANGYAGNRTISSMGRDALEFREKLYLVMSELSKSIVRDGEGATKVIQIIIRNARSRKEAKSLAYAIANSNLVKTAFYGGDPNWGRIISAVGSIGIDLPAIMVEVALEGIPIFRAGKGIAENEERIAAIMSRDEIKVELNVNMGDKGFSMFTSDLTFDYVKINSHYRT
ncbi:MAG: bifunctional glutamate N-acetyltransferase/amino-acid acetyltransferase ArgJ [Smithellaceae bacterium]|nr:bifunctional glutamate N-acetyltransferase/amino-acid acetyltransferase ArgJ [Smithellaceae bacterium]